jgi:hypothetical protein
VLISDEKTFTANVNADFSPESAQVLDLEDRRGREGSLFSTEL